MHAKVLPTLIFIWFALSANAQHGELINLKSPVMNGQEVPIVQKLNIQPKGMEFQVLNDRRVYASVSGKVNMVADAPGSLGKVVMVRTGDYIHVFTNLSEVFVTKDDEIQADQLLGEVNESNKLHFEVWKGTECIPREYITLTSR